MKKVFFFPGAHSVASSIGLLLARVSLGSMMLVAHGWGKLMDYGDLAGKFPDPLGVGHQLSLTLVVGAEVFCSAAIVLGLLTRWAALPLAVTMLVAVTVIHGDDPWAKKEFALLYAIPFLAMMFTGPGRFSLDSAIYGGSGGGK